MHPFKKIQKSMFILKSVNLFLMLTFFADNKEQKSLSTENIHNS
jgi:hypothetical protein